MIGDDRKARLIDAMSDAGLDMLLVYGNAWQNDYLRYATDFGILEGQALALVRKDGQVTLYLDSPLEVDRAQIDCPGVEVIHAPTWSPRSTRARPVPQPAHRCRTASPHSAPDRGTQPRTSSSATRPR